MKSTIWKKQKRGMLCLLILIYGTPLPVWGGLDGTVTERKALAAETDMEPGAAALWEENMAQEENALSEEELKVEETAPPGSDGELESATPPWPDGELETVTLSWPDGELESAMLSEAGEKLEETAPSWLDGELESATPSEAGGKLEETAPPGPDGNLESATPSEAAEKPEETATPSFAVRTATVSSALRLAKAGPVLWKEAGTAEELAQAVREGGNWRLTADIVLDGPALQWINRNPVIIDANSHTIYIDTLVYLFPHLQFSGIPGPDGILNVRKGGLLILCGALVDAGDQLAVKQEAEGVYLEENPDHITGQKIYADKPVAFRHGILDVRKSYPMVVQRGDQPPDLGLYPQSEEVLINSQGKNTVETIPVFWDFAAFEDAFDKRERFDITGNYGESITPFQPPVCTTAFLHPGSAVFLEYIPQRNGILRLQLLLDNPASSYAVEWSNDGDTWNSSENASYQTDPADNRIIEYQCFFNWNPPKYLSAVITTGGQVRYSETVMLTEDERIAPSDIGGTRGGSIGLNPPDRDQGGAGSETFGRDQGSAGGSVDDSGGEEVYENHQRPSAVSNMPEGGNRPGPDAELPDMEKAPEAETGADIPQEVQAWKEETPEAAVTGAEGSSAQTEQKSDPRLSAEEIIREPGQGGQDEGNIGGSADSGHKAHFVKSHSEGTALPKMLQIAAGLSVFGGVISAALWHQKLLTEILKLLARIKKQP